MRRPTEDPAASPTSRSVGLAGFSLLVGLAVMIVRRIRLARLGRLFGYWLLLFA